MATDLPDMPSRSFRRTTRCSTAQRLGAAPYSLRQLRHIDRDATVASNATRVAGTMAPHLRAVAAAFAIVGASPESAAETTPRSQSRAAGAPDPSAASAPAIGEPDESTDEEPSPSLVLPKLIPGADVPYPAGARGSATVLLELVVARTGVVTEVRVVRGEEPFARAAEEAAKSFRFEPATRDGKPIVARIHFSLEFAEPNPRASEALPAQVPGDPSPHPQGDAPTADTPPAREPVSITIQGRRKHDTTTLTKAEVRELPGAFGDAFRAIEVMPGITPLTSGVPYFYVRGAPPGSVGYFFDGVRVPVLFHAAAGPAVISPWFVEDVKLYSGGYPARYGRSAGGIVTADAADPTNAWRGMANVRVFDASAGVEAPFADGRGNVMAAGRYSYTAAAFSLFSPDYHLGYWDYQARAHYDVTSDDRVSLLAFGASDYAAQDERGTRTTLYDVRFHRIDARYDRRWSGTRRLRLAATLGDDRTLISDPNTRATSFFIRNSSATARAEYVDRVSRAVELRAGADWMFESARDQTTGAHVLTGPPYGGHDDTVVGARADAVLDLGSFVTVVPGLRLDVYHADGIALPAVEPRVAARFRVDENITLMHDFGVAHQLPSYMVPIPGFRPDLGNGLQRALQWSSGIEAKLPGGIVSSLTLFQNVLSNTTDRLSTAALRVADGTIHEDTRSLGRTFGAELVVKRDLTRRLGGFLAYTLARSVRMVERAAGPAAVDRTHVLNVAIGYDLGRNWRVGVRGLFYSGVPAQVAYLAAAASPPRTPPFYRFDWRLEKRWPFGDRRSISLVFEFLNFTLRREVTQMSCSAFSCRSDTVGPVSVPSIGVEAVF